MKQYKDLIKHVLENGTRTDDRTGVGTISVFGHQTRYNLQEGFPLLTTKETNFDMVVSELLWILEGSTDERRLAEIRYGKPRAELIGKNTVWTANADNQGKDLGFFNTNLTKELGKVYGYNWRSFAGSVDQIHNVIHEIKTNPSSRRLIVSAWNPEDIENNAVALPSCHSLFQFNVADGKLNCQLYQRSCDLFLGEPTNVASYALLTHMIAMVTGLEVGEFVHTFGDLHIYSNHIEQCKEVLSRECRELPRLIIQERDNIDGFTMSDFELEGYNPHPKIKGAMAV